MRLDFTKMNGAGNDFIMLDNREGHLMLSHIEIAYLCNRHRGIGADGVLILEKPSNSAAAAARMRYYNADGHEAEMCGNGARCFTRYAARFLEKEAGSLAFETAAGILEGELFKDQVKILMSIPHSIHLNESLEFLDQRREVHSLNTGVPHVVLFTKDLEKAPVVQEGRALRHHERFAPAGTNVNFVQVINPNSLTIRTFERGVEDETLACGTGVVASALIHHLLSKTDSIRNSTETSLERSLINSSISVTVRGGDTLDVDFVSEYSINKELPQITQVTLTGPADFVFEGTISI